MTRLQIILCFIGVTVGASACHFLLVSFLRRLKLRIAATAFLLSLAVYIGLFFLRPVSVILSDTFMLLSAAGFGVIVGRGIKTAPVIISFSIAASIVDILSFTAGPTRAIIKAAEQHGQGSLLNIMAFSIVLNGQVRPIIGLGDFLILGTYFVTLCQLNVGFSMQFVVPTAGLLAALMVGVMVGGVYAIPFMAAMVIGYLLFTHRLSRQAQPC
jgi:hypothetical protein